MPRQGGALPSRACLSLALAFLGASQAQAFSPPSAGAVRLLGGPVSQSRAYVATDSNYVAQRRDQSQWVGSPKPTLYGLLNWTVLGGVIGVIAMFSHRREHQLGSHSSMASQSHDSGRRSCLSGALVGASTLPLGVSVARADEELVEVYFGCGCFWHVQHEFVEAEKRILSRSDSELTAFVGYAGGKSGAKDGKVCYHNAASIADYGSLGHAEVVRLLVPPSKFKFIAEEYCKLFDKEGNRPDQFGDRGPEYRNLVGLPGGTKSPLAKDLVEASKKQGDKLDFAKGKGDDKDVRATTFLMDIAEFPFYIAEPYHQFHDGFAFGEDYPNSYNSLGDKYAKVGLVKDSGCPNGLLGLGFAGL